MKKVLLILIFLILCVAVQSVFVSGSAAYGDSVSDLEKKISYLENQNQSLEIEIASLTSCSKIVQRATEVGLTEAIPTLSLAKGDFSVALKR